MAKIGVFDSGFGGLTVLKGLRGLLPEYDYLYLGDTARAPYGTRSEEVIYRFTEQAVDYLFDQDCELIILACNTASSEALRKIQQEYLVKKHPQKRVLGVVIPACEAVAESGYQRVGVIATNSTIESGSYVREIKKLNKDVEIIQQPCSLLVPIIEAGEIHEAVLGAALDGYLAGLREMEAIVLGCTHYEIIGKEIEKRAREAKIISQSGVVAERLADYLKRHPEIEGKLSRDGSVVYRSTDITDRFERFGRKIIGSEIEIERITLI